MAELRPVLFTSTSLGRAAEVGHSACSSAYPCFRRGKSAADSWVRNGLLVASSLGSTSAVARRRLDKRPGKRFHRIARYGMAYGDEFVGEEVDKELAESLQARTFESLDFDFVLQKLQSLCYTARAAEMAVNPADLMAGSAAEARDLFGMVLELTNLEDEDLELEHRLDISAEVEACSKGGVFEEEDAEKVAECLEAFLRLRNGLAMAAQRGLQIPLLMEISSKIELPDELLDVMLEAFVDGELSEKKFPEIKESRERLRFLEDACGAKLREVLASGKYQRYLEDDGYSKFGKRFVLSVKSEFKSKVGKTLDESRTGRTAYVEPYELTEMGQEIEQLNQELKLTIRRILSVMSSAVARSVNGIRTCLEAAAKIDLARARLFLGEDLQGEIPDVRDEGIISCRQARNPCLVLRERSKVVSYKLQIGDPTQGLIISGPNAGGKTVLLKTMGLLALLARCGIPVPGGEAPRVDFFKVVLAEVGDMQTIVDDLSTYSAHLVASRIMLSVTKTSKKRSLVLVDEAGTGTDPQQGAALAQAIIEAFLESGARVVATTHCLQLKSWAMEDNRTETVAMEYKDGKPTFRLAQNAIGESHAMETALRLDLPKKLVARAEKLLSEDQQTLLVLQRQAEKAEQEFMAQTEQAREAEAEAREAKEALEEQADALQRREEGILEMEVDLAKRRELMRKQLQADFKAKWKTQERRLEEVVKRLKEEAVQNGARFKVAGDALEELRIEKDHEAEAAYQEEVRKRSEPILLKPEDKLGIGDWVMILSQSGSGSPWRGSKAFVQSASDPRLVTVALHGSYNTLMLPKTELARTSAPIKPKKPVSGNKHYRKEGKAAPMRDYSKMGW